MISKQITQYRYDALIKEQEKLNEDLEFYLDEQRKARDKGDLSENEEYSIASKNVQQSRQRLIQIADELADVEIIEIDKGPRIGLGCKVEIIETDENHKPLAEPRQFYLDEKGDTIIDKVLGIHSVLGKAILNGTNGSYKIQTEMGTMYYDVKKILEE